MRIVDLISLKMPDQQILNLSLALLEAPPIHYSQQDVVYHRGPRPRIIALRI